MQIKQISIFVENKSGRLAEITSALAGAGIDIRAISIADTSDFGILRLIVDDPGRAVEILRSAGMTVSLTSVIAAGFTDRPGEFAKVMGILSENTVGVEYMYAFISRDRNKAYVILRVDNDRRAVEILQNAGVELLTEEDIRAM